MHDCSGIHQVRILVFDIFLYSQLPSTIGVIVQQLFHSFFFLQNLELLTTAFTQIAANDYRTIWRPKHRYYPFIGSGSALGAGHIPLIRYGGITLDKALVYIVHIQKGQGAISKLYKSKRVGLQFVNENNITLTKK